MEKILMIGIGGFLGANLRYWFTNWAIGRWGDQFPMGTLVINVTGSFIIAFFLALTAEKFVVDPLWRLFFVTGFLGAYTTFSTFSYESVELLLNGSRYYGIINPIISLVLGILAAMAGLYLGKNIISVL
ncbi:MAG: fluoride efflux transporter CrcB [Anaerolineaceae bacterium]|nr:fluoride efflux transporter CrcB [Anaerolineaceae bacterium]